MIERPPPAEDLYASAERRRAARALLLHPLLTDDGPHAEDLARVRRHRDALVALFADGLGYRLEVEPGAARLFKAGLGRDPSRPLLRRSGKPFPPRAYTLLCLVLAALTRCKDQLLVDELVAEVRSAAADAGLDVDLDATRDRRALHAALLALVSLGVLVERDGDLVRWGEDARAQALLDIRRERLRLLVAAPLSTVSSRDELLDRAALRSAAGGARVAVRRRLLESPVLSAVDLADDHAEWWRRSRHREREWLRDQFGVELELRAEGALAVDAAGELSDDDFPGTGSTKHYALLLLERLVTTARERALAGDAAERTWQPVVVDDVAAAAREVMATYGRSFRRAHRDDPAALHTEATELLVRFGLVRVDATDGWRVHAAAARYAARPTLAEAAGSGETSLFDEQEETT